MKLTKKAIKKYLDEEIRIWRKIRDKADNLKEEMRAFYYIDAYQLVRITLFKKFLGKKKEEKEFRKYMDRVNYNSKRRNNNEIC